MYESDDAVKRVCSRLSAIASSPSGCPSRIGIFRSRGDTRAMIKFARCKDTGATAFRPRFPNTKRGAHPRAAQKNPQELNCTRAILASKEYWWYWRQTG